MVVHSIEYVSSNMGIRIVRNDDIRYRIDTDGTMTFKQDGLLHRTGGPATIHPDGWIEFCSFGSGLHRIDGPAATNGEEHMYAINGHFMDQMEFFARTGCL